MNGGGAGLIAVRQVPVTAARRATRGTTPMLARTIDGAKEYVGSGTLDQVDWNAELLQGDLGRREARLPLGTRV